MANFRERTFTFKCLVFVLIFALASHFVQYANLQDVREHAVLIQRSVSDGLSVVGLRDKLEDNQTLQRIDTSPSFDKAAGTALEELLNVWDLRIRNRDSNRTSMFELPSVVGDAGVPLQDLFNTWDAQTERKSGSTSISDQAVKNEGNTSGVGNDLLKMVDDWNSKVRTKSSDQIADDNLGTEGNSKECSKKSVLPPNFKLKASDGTVQFAFYEGNRFVWIYRSLFKRPADLRFCNCNFKSNHKVRVKFEKLASNLKSYDIVVFPQDQGTKPIKWKTWRSILANAPYHQRRVYATFEGPYKLIKVKSKKTAASNGDRFHWSWTLNSRSEFAMPYGYYKPISDVNLETSNRTEAMSVNWTKGKTSLIVWMSSWVNTDWRRQWFVEKLSQLISVDKYGRKFKSCPKGSPSCEKKIREYKFYLALENSCCKEYITEKFWRALDWGMVPVVVGASKADYERLAPPNSFIFVDDFKSLEDLANYLVEIDKNDTLYNEFFRWRTQGKVYQNYPNYRRKLTSKSPETWFYSCNAVCRVTERYLREREELVEPSSGFDPHSEWWGRSCRKCGVQTWFKEFQK